MLNEKMIEELTTKILTQNDTDLLRETLASLYQEQKVPNVVHLIRLIRNYNFPNESTEEIIIKTIVDTCKDWNKGHPFTFSNVLQLLFQNSRDGKLVTSLHKILISYIEQEIIDIKKIYDNNTLNYLSHKNNEQFALFILKTCDQDTFNKICTYVIKNDWLMDFAQMMKQNQSNFLYR